MVVRDSLPRRFMFSDGVVAGADPVWFAERFFGVRPWSKQREVLRLLRDHDLVAVRSCNGSGKTFTAALATLWWLVAHQEEATVITTAPSERQVKELLWREIRKLHGRNPEWFGGKLTSTRLELSERRFAYGFSTDTAGRFQGFHSENILVIVDEAAEMREHIFDAIFGSLTSENAKMLMIGNPSRLAGTFYDAFHKNRGRWKTVHISAFDTPAFRGGDPSPRVRPGHPPLASLRSLAPPYAEAKGAGGRASAPLDSCLRRNDGGGRRNDEGGRGDDGGGGDGVEESGGEPPPDRPGHPPLASLRSLAPPYAGAKGAGGRASGGVDSCLRRNDGGGRGNEGDGGDGVEESGGAGICGAPRRPGHPPLASLRSLAPPYAEAKGARGLATPKWAGMVADERGVNSSEYQVRVLGEFPEEADDTLIALRLVEGAVGRELEEGLGGDVVMGVDVARFGSDETVAIVRRGGCVLEMLSFGRSDLMGTTGRVMDLARRHDVKAMYVDEVGLGSGVVDRARELDRVRTVGVNGGSKARDSERYLNVRAEMYDGLRRRFADGDISIPDDSELISQLSSLTYGYTSRGQLQIESKDRIRSSGRKSPDKADALALAFGKHADGDDFRIWVMSPRVRG